ncbi:unnamed protein product [Malus baccata var. baccata]
MEISSFTLSVPRSPLFLPFQSSQSTFLSSNGTTSLSFSKTSVNGSALSPEGMTCNALFGLGMLELVVIAGVEAMVFGPKKLPEMRKSIGMTVKSFQQRAEPKERPRLTLIVCNSTRGNTDTPAELGSSAAHNARTP